ncbi:threonine ammonia-lyase [Glacieibacterium megasporae]|uniref:threonine ammonia-lyase n=1 Tax=Glacieibacterium megasporae TaxID=2835787 RepID=UPI001C1E64C4|nr:threonine/serine dehydratase [Polymorphobacter megasporae]UAJ09440.1 threonine/serine dehydratase [Polymorphobacter megasporae]
MVSIDDVRTAAVRLHGVTVRTPLLRADALDAICGGQIWLKPECLQRTGSFKIRGAYNRLAAMTAAERARGVVAFSSGNHAQGVALAARLLGIDATIVMPSDAPAVKVDATRDYGADVVFYDRSTEDRAAVAARLAAVTGATVVPSYDDPHIVAGQGTAGLEVGEQLAAAGVVADLALVCCGGGGLASGFAVGSGLPVITVEPTGYDDVARSLSGGAIVPVDSPRATICDALQTLVTVPLTFDILRDHGTTGVAVTDAEAAQAVGFAFRTLKLVVEPGGAVALAAALTGRVDLRGKTAVVVLSGGNVDADIFAHCLAA